MLIFRRGQILCHILTKLLQANRLALLGYIPLSGNPYPATASFTYLVNQNYQLLTHVLLTRLRAMDKNCDLQVKIRIID